jgi:hypothetical protein
MHIQCVLLESLVQNYNVMYRSFKGQNVKDSRNHAYHKWFDLYKNINNTAMTFKPFDHFATRMFVHHWCCKNQGLQFGAIHIRPPFVGEPGFRGGARIILKGGAEPFIIYGKLRLCRGPFVGPLAELICAERRRRDRVTHGTTIFVDGRTVGTARPSARRFLCRGLALGT